MLKWELARYLMDSKKVIDSLMFISENIENLRNLNIRNIIYEKLEAFYVKIRIVYDKTFTKSEKKKLALEDNIYKATMYESDKNYAHKDDDYKVTELESLNYLIEILKQQLVHCRKMCNKSLPNMITLDFIPYDHDLFRIVNGITPKKEEILEKIFFMNEEENLEEKKFKNLKVFEDTEDIKLIRNANEYGVVIKNGINLFEGLQNRQDACIKINVLFNQEIWCNINGNLIELEKQFERLCRQIGLF